MTAIDQQPPPSLTGTHADPGLAATIRSEWTKLWTSRAPLRNLILGSVLGIALSALSAFAVGATFSDWNVAQQLDFDPILYSFNGSILTAIFFVAVGSRLATSEYASGMIRLTLSITPKRWRVVAAKAIVVSVVTWGFGAIALVGMFGVSQAFFAGFDLETASLLDGDVLRTVLVIVVLIPLFPLLALAGGNLFRSTAPTLTVVLLLIFGPSFFGMLFPRWWQENIFSLFPGSAADAISIGHLTESAMYHDTPIAMVLVIAWTIVPLVAATLVLDRRDA